MAVLPVTLDTGSTILLVRVIILVNFRMPLKL